MKKEDFAEVFGDINNKHILDAREGRKTKKPVWLKWGAMAACLCMAIIGAVQLWPSQTASPALSGGVCAEVIKIIETGRCTVEVTQEDENFARGDIIGVTYGAVRLNSKETSTSLAVGDLVAITYNGVEKVGNDYEVTVPYVEIITFPSNENEKTEYNKQIYEIEPFKIQFQLPEGWSLGDYDPQAVSYLYNGVWSRVGVFNADGVCVGAVGYNIYDADEYVAGEPMSIYHQVALGNDYQFNVRETYTVAKETDQYQTATVDVYYDPGFMDGIGEDGVTNYGILTYAIDQTVYIAFEFDHEAVTSKQVEKIANSVEFTFEEATNETQPGGTPAEEVFDVTVSHANWAAANDIYAGALNADKMMISSVQHLPIYKFDTLEEFQRFKSAYDSSNLEMEGYTPSFNDTTAKYDETFFADNTLMLVFVGASSGTYRFGVNSVFCDGALLCIHVEQTNNPEALTDDTACWFITVAVPDSMVENCTEFDADLNNNFN